MIKAVIFDYYGVFQQDFISEWTLQNNVELTDKHRSYIKKHDEGMIDRAELVAALNSLSGTHTTKQKFYAPASLNSRVIDCLELLLYKQIKIGLLSNASSNLYEILTANNLLHKFDAVVLSSDIGISKPDSRIFTCILKQINIPAELCLFIDDRLENVEAAQELGFKTIHYTSGQDLINEVRKYIDFS